jgi:hypothetical protein
MDSDEVASLRAADTKAGVEVKQPLTTTLAHLIGACIDILFYMRYLFYALP